MNGSPSTRRPGEGRDPYRGRYLLAAGADYSFNHDARGLWVPAFAGTTALNVSPSTRKACHD
jgi:hypothetical protein